MSLIRVSDRNSPNTATVESYEVAATIAPWYAFESATVQATVTRLQEGINVGNTAAVDTLADMLDLDLQYL